MKHITIFVTKCVGWMLHRLHRGGSFPGEIALRLCPDILKKLNYRGKVIVVTGTNGKTSTANMIAASLKQANKQVINNTKGDNLKYGVATSLLMHARLSGYIDSDMVVLEVDELSMPYVMSHVKVDVVVITNFFRDQLDRAKEMEQLIQTVEQSLEHFAGDLVLNGNDPNVMRFSYHCKHALPHFYGVEPTQHNNSQEAKEGTFCPICSSPLIYESYQYSHIGEFHCPSCDFKTPSHAHMLMAVNLHEEAFDVLLDTYRAPFDAVYMIYNCMAVLCVFDVLHLDRLDAREAFLHFQMPAGRNEHFPYQGHELILNLVKNPTGANEVIKQIVKCEHDKSILFVLNDNAQDGTDVSWIYDTDFEHIFHAHTKCICCSGKRAYEAALRMKYGGYEGKLIVIEDVEQAVMQAIKESKEDLFIMATYTALAPVRSYIRSVVK